MTGVEFTGVLNSDQILEIMEREYPAHSWAISRQLCGNCADFHYAAHISDLRYSESRGRRGNHYLGFSDSRLGALLGAYHKLLEGKPDEL